MNRTIIITGADNGIGLAMAQSLLEMGDRVAVFDLSLDHLDQAHPNLLPFQCDITNPEQILLAIEAVINRWKGIDILINNACLAFFKPFVERTMDDIRHEFEVNYFGYLNMINAVLPLMRKQKHGVIHNVSSGVGFTGMLGMTGYTSSKGAIESLTRTLSLELADDGIIVNVMHPPLTRTKSASGFGVPPEMMADPMVVGRGLAKHVGSNKPFITPDFSSGLGIMASRHFPLAMGRFMKNMAKRAQVKN
ncbi:MAG TPA: SDR family NAD(P)-dependent oxidoreductase [Anaerolineales bacterium]|nr:SDR family NAD(P)-dependent oxidoreductase [Anaerolineales bacterium]